MHNRFKIFSVVIAGLLISACGSSPKVEDGSAGDAVSAQGQAGGADGSGQSGALQGGQFQGSPFDDPSNPLSNRVIYFDFDSSEVRSEYRDVLAAHANYLSQHNAANVRLEGNADERGSSGYNLGLGERRAQSVQRLMRSQGAGNPQMEVISNGEEKPAVEGHDESAWSKNRRVEIIYKSQ